MLDLGKTASSDTAKNKKSKMKSSPMPAPMMMVNHAGMTAGNPMPKMPTQKQKMDQACKDSMVSSIRRWTVGEITDKQHKENMDRAKKSISNGHKI